MGKNKLTNCNRIIIRNRKVLIAGMIVFGLIALAQTANSQEIKTFTYSDGGKYEGETRDGMRHGRGTMTWPDGTKYVGDFKNDQKSGRGKYTWPNGDEYEGEWKDDKIHGKGTLTYTDGTKYVGDFKNDQKSGRGKYIWPNGDEYEGEWKDDERYGQGRMTWSNGRKYVGEWKDDKRNGRGTLTFPNGDSFEGEFKDNKMHGNGTYTYTDGRKYIGEFKDDKFVAGKTIKPSGTGELIDRVAAVVNDDVITLSELKEAVLSTNQNTDDPQVQSQILEHIIEEKLFQQEAKKLGIQVTEKEIDTAIEGVKRRFNLTEEQMGEVLKKQNLTPEGFREQWRRQLLANKLIGTQVQGQIAVTEDEIKKYYEENYEKLESTEEMRIAHILIPVTSPEEEEQAQNLSLEVFNLARSGEDFSELAKKYSKDLSTAERGGDMGYFKKGELVEELEKAVIAASPGEIVGPVRSSAGYHVIKVIDKKKSETTSIDNSRDEIRETLYQQKVENAIKTWLENVKKTAYIEKKL